MSPERTRMLLIAVYDHALMTRLRTHEDGIAAVFRYPLPNIVDAEAVAYVDSREVPR